jgi:hypothetical protein
MSEQYLHIGSQPITVRGTSYEKGSTIVASQEDMAFFLQIGAVELKTTPPSAGHKPFIPAKDKE